MPLGFERLNERKQRPNSLINFIKPLPGRDSEYAQDFLERIAAICHPIMKSNRIAVMSLEEFPTNPEFVGRNFNAGEVIQLVLKSRDGRWLPFRHVQMVMMHELAHCKQMNHSRAFWAVRNAYAAELKELWAKRYTGDGFWGQGKTVLSQKYEREDMPPPELEPKSLCGGTYQSRGKKRRRGKGKETLSYAERKQRRILKKFGAGGTTLGDDETKRLELEGGKTVKGKPRVAGSARGRELRAAAALARFEQAQTEKIKTEEELLSSDSSTEGEEEDTEQDSALDFDGKQMLDSHGHGMVKVCEGEDEEDQDAQREMKELYEVSSQKNKPTKPLRPMKDVKGDKSTVRDIKSPSTTSFKRQSSSNKAKSSKPISASQTSSQAKLEALPQAASSIQCSVCSLINEPAALTCAACANVLDPERLRDHWKCGSLSCRGGSYVNAADAGVCGICGASKPR